MKTQIHALALMACANKRNKTMNYTVEDAIAAAGFMGSEEKAEEIIRGIKHKKMDVDLTSFDTYEFWDSGYSNIDCIFMASALIMHDAEQKINSAILKLWRIKR